MHSFEIEDYLLTEQAKLLASTFKGADIQIEKALINNHLLISKVF